MSKTIDSLKATLNALNETKIQTEKDYRTIISEIRVYQTAIDILSKSGNVEGKQALLDEAENLSSQSSCLHIIANSLPPEDTGAEGNDGPIGTEGTDEIINIDGEEDNE